MYSRRKEEKFTMMHFETSLSGDHTFGYLITGNFATASSYDFEPISKLQRGTSFKDTHLSSIFFHKFLLNCCFLRNIAKKIDEIIHYKQEVNTHPFDKGTAE